ANFVRAAKPPLPILNTPALDVWNENATQQLHPRSRLLAEDTATLLDTYAPYWGPIYLAGRHWRDLPGGEDISFEIVIPGDYTLIADHPVRVNGRLYPPGATLRLNAGPHALQTVLAESNLRLLWGRGTTIPAEEPSPLPIYQGL